MKSMFPNRHLIPPGKEGTIPAPTSTENYTSPLAFVKAFTKQSNEILVPIIASRLQKVA
jgi:hypothetical protein